MKFSKVQYGNTETTEININVSKRVEYFLHYWNFVFQKNTGLLFIHHEKFESHRSLIHKIEIQINENKRKYARRIKSLLIEHPYFQNNNIIIRNSPKTKNELIRFKNDFNNNWFSSGIRNENKNETKQLIIKAGFGKIKKLVLRNYLNRLIKNLIAQVVTDKPINNTFKKDIKFLINATIVELYDNGFSLDYIRNLAEIIVFPQEHKNQFPYDKTFRDFGNNKESFKKYKGQTSSTIKLHEQIACLKNLTDNKKYPKQKGFCVFRIDDFDFQLEEPVTIWNVTFYNPQKIRMIKTRIPETAGIELDFYPFSYPKNNNPIDSTCNAIIRVDYRMFDWNHPVIEIHKVINKVDKALQVLKRIKLDFVNADDFVSGRISSKTCILMDNQFYYIQPINIELDSYSFKIENYQKSVFKDVLIDMKLYQKNQKLMDIYAFLCQVKTDEFTFNFKDYWTVFVEANFPNNPEGFINECKAIFRNDLPNRLFMSTKIFLNNSLNHSDFEYSQKQAILEQTGLNIPEKKSFNAEKFKSNYSKLKKHKELEFEFFNDILAELDECQNNPEKYIEKIDKWLNDIIWSAFAERNLESHNNIVTDYSLIKLKDEFLYIGELFLRNKISN